MCIQVEVDLTLEKEEMGKGKSRKKMPLHLTKGWNFNDQNLMNIYLEFMTIRMEIWQLYQLLFQKNDKISDIIRFAIQLSKRKTYRQLIKKLNADIPKIFDF